MSNDPLFIVIVVVLGVLLTASLARAMLRGVGSGVLPTRRTRELGVGTVISSAPMGDAVGGRVEMRITLELARPDGSTKEVGVQRPVPAEVAELLVPGAVVIVEYDESNPYDMELRFDLTPAERASLAMGEPAEDPSAAPATDGAEGGEPAPGPAAPVEPPPDEGRELPPPAEEAFEAAPPPVDDPAEAPPEESAGPDQIAPLATPAPPDEPPVPDLDDDDDDDDGVDDPFGGHAG